MPVKKHITILDGSLGAPQGNTSRLTHELMELLAPHAHIEKVDLNAQFPSEELLEKSDGFVFASGTYWDSWGSPLQRFLEESTQYEGSTLWLGKPAAVLITMHSVGGKEVLSRLQGVLSTLGLLVPPMSGLAYSMANHLALQATSTSQSQADFWSPADLKIIAQNLRKALHLPRDWTPWPVHEGNGAEIWYR